MPMGSRLLLCNKGKFRSLFDGLDDRKLHPRRERFWRFFKRTMDEGNSFIVVLLPSSSSKPSIFPKFFGNLSSFEQSDILRVFKDVKLKIEIGRLERFLQSLRSKSIRPVECSTNNDGSFIAVSLKQCFDKRDIFFIISGNFFNFERPPRLKNSRASKRILRGRLSRHLQPLKSN